jgi:RNA polymerase sigma-B factor
MGQVDLSPTLSLERSREQLIEAHLPLVRSIAQRYSGHGEDLDDIVQVGAIALVKASKRFDPDRGVTFGTFAAPAIEGEIQRHLRDRAHPVRIPRDLHRMSRQLRRYERELSGKLGRPPTLPELADALGVEERDVKRALDSQHAREAAPLPEDGALDLDGAAEAHAETNDRVDLEASLRALDKRERRIVFLRFHGDLTVRQIANEIGLSQAHVSRLLAGALEKLRAELATSSGAVTELATSMGADAELAASSGAGANGDTTPVISTDGTPRIRCVGDTGEIPSEQEPEAPRAARGYSGRFLVRMPKTLHEQLANAAERERVSLNRFVTDALAATIGESKAEKAVIAATDPDAAPTETVPSPAPPQPHPRALRVALATNLVVVVIAGLVAVALLAVALSRGI